MAVAFCLYKKYVSSNLAYYGKQNNHNAMLNATTQNYGNKHFDITLS